MLGIFFLFAIFGMIILKYQYLLVLFRIAGIHKLSNNYSDSPFSATFLPVFLASIVKFSFVLIIGVIIKQNINHNKLIQI